MRRIIIAFFGAFVLGSTAAAHAFDAADICAAEGSDSTLVEHEECNKFYICSKGSPVPIDCPKHPTLLYNDNIKACDWPDNVECGDRIINEEPYDEDEEEPKLIEVPVVEEVNDDPSKAPEICAAESSDGKLIAHEDCNKFYICSGGVPITNKCGRNPILYFNPELRACDWPENVDCSSRTEDTETDEKDVKVENNNNDVINNDDNRSYEEKAVEACTLENSDGLLLAHGDCDKFYMCSEGRPVPFQCPQTPLLFYNNLLQYCDWADKVSCGDRVIPESVFAHKQ